MDDTDTLRALAPVTGPGSGAVTETSRERFLRRRRERIAQAVLLFVVVFSLALLRGA